MFDIRGSSLAVETNTFVSRRTVVLNCDSLNALTESLPLRIMTPG